MSAVSTSDRSLPQIEGMNKHELTIRPAISVDKARVLACCAATWEDGDYNEAVWDDLFHDPSAALLVGECAGQPVALAHLSVMEGEGWFEGLRVAVTSGYQPEPYRFGLFTHML